MSAERESDAVRRASAAWRACAVHVRGELRAHGVHGELRRLDDYASGTRGAGFARFMAEFAEYVRDESAGQMTAESLIAELGAVAAETVIAAYAQRPAA